MSPLIMNVYPSSYLGSHWKKTRIPLIFCLHNNGICIMPPGVVQTEHNIKGHFPIMRSLNRNDHPTIQLLKRALLLPRQRYCSYLGNSTAITSVIYNHSLCRRRKKKFSCVAAAGTVKGHTWPLAKIEKWPIWPHMSSTLFCNTL
jgi:hypothetical protein